ncbi:g10453 [Coccomyxa viridis]|uniref:G10453 protein n=1 Tax=Coccomyxa viridis TaxID=1274662 RepID=A0ABP1G5J9_9CHLO
MAAAETSDMHAPFQAPLGDTEAVAAPPKCSWVPDHTNKVRLIGLVGAAPDVRRVGDQTIAQVSLGIRPKTGNTNEISWVVCDFWNHEAMQVAQHVKKGMQLAIGGHLKQSKWLDRTTGAQREAMRVVAEYLMIVDASHGVLDGSAAPGSGRAAGSAPRKAAERSPRIAEQPLRLYNEGHPLPAIAQMLGKAPKTVMANIIDSIAAGAQADIPQLASDFQMGPANSPWMTADEIAEATQAAIAANLGPDGQPATIHSIYLRHIREALSRHPTAGAKQASQEQLSPEAESLTYNQIKLVKALMQQGISWNDLIVNPPGPARVAQPPTNIPSVPAGAPAQHSRGGSTDQLDDDVIPF